MEYRPGSQAVCVLVRADEDWSFGVGAVGTESQQIDSWSSLADLLHDADADVPALPEDVHERNA